RNVGAPSVASGPRPFRLAVSQQHELSLRVVGRGGVGQLIDGVHNATVPTALNRSRSAANANRAPFELDEVAVLQLPTTPALDLAVHAHVPVEDDLFGVPAGVEQPGELEELPEANDVASDGDVVDRIAVRHS